MSSRAVRLLLYFWMGVGLLLVLALVWWGASSGYNRLVAAGAGRISPESVRVEAIGNDFELSRAASVGVAAAKVGLTGSIFQAGLLVVLALVLATPSMEFWTRIGWATGVVVLFVLLNMGTLAFGAWTLTWASDGGFLTAGRIQQLLAVIYLAVPFVLAAAWCWHFWLPGLAGGGREQMASR